MNRFFQILDCSDVLGTCCTDYSMVVVLDYLKKILDLIQLVVPILLMVALVVQFTQLVVNPDDEKKRKSMFNKFKAAILCFLLPFIVNLTLGILPDDMDTFQLGACWDTASISREILKSENSTFVSTTSKSPQQFIVTSTSSSSGGSSSGSSGGSGNGSLTGKAIVEYAKSFVGNRYCWGGKDPHVCADCSGFVSYVFGHFGIHLIAQTNAMWNQTDMYTLVSPGDIKAGDVVMYNGHVGILTGNGEEMVHASSPREGIKISSTYRYSPIRGIMRIKGVN